MIIGITADSHDNITAIESMVNTFKKENVKLLLHAGDIVAPFALKAFFPLGKKIISVFGNNDGEREGLKALISGKGEITDEPRTGEIDGVKYFLAHREEIALPVAESGLYDIVIYGHTHSPVRDKKSDTLIINPGELCGWVTGRKTAVIFDTESRMARLITL